MTAAWYRNLNRPTQTVCKKSGCSSLPGLLAAFPLFPEGGFHITGFETCSVFVVRSGRPKH